MARRLLAALVLLTNVHCNVHDPRVQCANGVQLEGSDDCPGLDAALLRCEGALAEAGLTMNWPRVVDVDPNFAAATLGTSAGTSSEYLDAVVILSDDWRGDVALCHELIHNSIPGRSASERDHVLPNWLPEYWVAIERAR